MKTPTDVRVAPVSDRLVATACVLVYAAAVPVLEVNATHVFDPMWPAHARLHEVWQLITNSALGAWALWLLWVRGNTALPALLALFVTGGFLAAYFLRAQYGGSMVLGDGSEKLVFGANLGLVAFGIIAAASAWLLLRARRRPTRRVDQSLASPPLT
jgi:hypothetical protein